jgi:hypothetical protein
MKGHIRDVRDFYSLTGFAYVEVNGKKGFLITIRTGSGQGGSYLQHPFPTVLATEPLNRVLAQNYRNLMYSTEGNLTIGPILFAADNLYPLSIERENDPATNHQLLQPIYNCECSPHQHQENHSTLHQHLTQSHRRTQSKGD